MSHRSRSHNVTRVVRLHRILVISRKFDYAAGRGTPVIVRSINLYGAHHYEWLFSPSLVPQPNGVKE
jgi:hypothetical protein